MKNFEIRNIFCADRLRSLNSESASPRKSFSSSKESLKRSMGELLHEIVSSLTPEGSYNNSSDTDLVDHKIIH